MWQCPTCSQDNVETDRFCARCGRPLPVDVASSLEPPSTVDEDPVDIDAFDDMSQVVERVPVKHGIDSLLGPISVASSDAEPEAGRLKVAGHDDGDDPNRPGRNTMVEGLSAVVAEARKSLEEGTEPAPEVDVDSTKTQRLDPLPRRQTVATPAIPRAGTAQWKQPAEGRPRASVQTDPEFLSPTEGPPGGWVAVVLALCAGLLLGTGLCAIAYLTFGGMEAPQGEPSKTAPQKPAPLTIGEGPFLRGLSNDYRLMFADICPKVAEDPKNECKEEIALAGEYPMKEVALSAFRMDAWEVSNAEWAACASDGACPQVDWGECANWNVRGLVPFLEVPQDLRADEHPVVCVTHKEAATFCKHAGGTLPSPDQWEKAARGADAYLFPWGTNWTSAAANWGERDMARVIVAGKLDGYELTSPVWEFPDGKSPTGVYNLAGNAAEWVAAGDDSLGAVARGGSWRSHPLDVRSTVRFRLKADARRTDVGFRCVYPPGE
jgi:formylglycine-generating enzyme required for sulfatase activity